MSSRPQDDNALRAALMKCWEEQQTKEEQDEGVLRIRRKRAARLRKQNNATATIRNFPTEILSLILSYACANLLPKRKGRREIFVLGRICSKWRNVILSMPSLWSRLTMTVESYRREQRDLDLLQYYLDNVKHIPFSLSLVFVRPFTRHRVQFEQISQILLQERNAHKMHTLRLEHVPEGWIPWISCLQSLCNLEIASIATHRRSTSALSLTNFAHLSRVELSAIPVFLDTQLPWMQITSLTLRHMSIDVCASLLVQCPNLLEFHCFSSHKRAESPGPVLPQIVDLNLEYVEHFTWTYQPNPMLASFYIRLRLPSLHTLQWYSRSHRRSSIETGEASALRTLFTGLSSGLSHLHLHRVGMWPADLLKHVFAHTPNLRVLHLGQCKYAFVVNALSILNYKDPVRQIVSLPLLEKIVIQDPIEPVEIQQRRHLETKLATLIVSMFRDRDPDKKKLFSLQLSQAGGLTSKVMRKVYCALRVYGYAFNIWVDSSMVHSVEDFLERRGRIKDASEKGEPDPLPVGKDEDWDDESRLAYSTGPIN